MGTMAWTVIAEEAPAQAIAASWGVPANIDWAIDNGWGNTSERGTPCVKNPAYLLRNGLYAVKLSTEFNSAGTVFTGLWYCQ